MSRSVHRFAFIRSLRAIRRRLRVLFWRLADRLRKPRALPLPPDAFTAYEEPSCLRQAKRERP
jgi:hypothetical protein